MQEVHQSAEQETQYAPGEWVDPRAQLKGNVQGFMAQVYGWMGLAILMTAAVAWFMGTNLAALNVMYDLEPGGYLELTGMGWVVLFSPFIFHMFTANRVPTMSAGMAKGSLMIFAALMGASLSYVPLAYPVGSIAGVFVATALMFGGVSAWGYFTKRDISGWGGFLLMALFGIIGGLLLSMFMQGLNMIVMIIGILVFAGLSAYKTQFLKQYYLVNGGGTNLAVIGAMMLYMSFINIFIFMLHLFGGGRD